MKVKLIKVRLSDEFIYGDQKILDQFLAQNNILKFESAFVKDEESYWSVILYYEEMKMTVNESKNQKYSAEENDGLNPDEIKILESLKLWRSEKAKDQKLPVYFIATNNELLSIAKYKPLNKEELIDIKGFGKHKIENYGEEIIEILESV
ncbi:HRDC domain-containing protein [Chryseobacterium suipulveris]|uniref:HRDC domain-containing protein n=1 Tax=Chryseobacterium suipulveris TaxID=2929800 RepID=A0ABY4BVP8_9FLAO|nr:HRDC domain-containing protein [Chryseobacterium suipulveris]UOE41771.1 HRDC domain-containing protein [Chryseobacterium suipulveris]